MNTKTLNTLIRDALTRVPSHDRKQLCFALAGCIWREGLPREQAREILEPHFDATLVHRALWRCYGEPSGVGTLHHLRLHDLVELFSHDEIGRAHV